MDIRYKILRVMRWGPRVGFLNAFVFEVQQTMKRPVISFWHKGLGRKVHLRSSSSDISVFEHVFIEDEFDIDLQAPELILDGGANCGLASLYFACRFPQARIVAIEPDEENCKLAERNVSGLNVAIIQSAIWSRTTSLKISNPDSDPWSFQCVEADPDDPESFAAQDMSSLLGEYHCDLLKLDIEGAEKEVFREPSWLGKVSKIVVEIHGEEAGQLVRSACEGWIVSQTGEKMLLSR